MSKPIVKAHFHGGPNDGHSEFVAREVLEAETIPTATYSLDGKHVHIYQAAGPITPEAETIDVFHCGVTTKEILAEVVDLDVVEDEI